ncbi:hypothetical protein RRG08_039121 [Elysia crispata]|uniref:Uncharacterized protein n=1 Tax=Elysia crispata TaxID=231223 RepID=A0AAE1A7Z9_9GAST|nr:hypothetical protein RRG08_039121 [Elysia crispata]
MAITVPCRSGITVRASLYGILTALFVFTTIRFAMTLKNDFEERMRSKAMAELLKHRIDGKEQRITYLNNYLKGLSRRGQQTDQQDVDLDRLGRPYQPSLTTPWLVDQIAKPPMDY